MQCYPSGLKQQLETKIAPVYLLYGNEPFLIEESANLIRDKIRALEVDFYKLNQNEQRDWVTLLKNTSEQASLWSKGQLFEILIPGKISASDAAEFSSLFEHPSPDTYLIVKMGSLNKQQQKAKWFEHIQQNGVTVPHWPFQQEAFLKWVLARAKARDLTLNKTELAQLLAHTENNAQAAAQEIERLALLALDKEATSAHSLPQESQYEVFDLVLAAIRGNAHRVLSILAFFKNTESAPMPLILWAISGSLRTIAYDTHTLPIHQHNALKQALVAHPVQKTLCRQLLGQLTEVDKHVKSGKEAWAWHKCIDLFITLSMRSCESRLTTP